ncbi:hypothetical protein [Streptomyces sp. NPDC054784]
MTRRTVAERLAADTRDMTLTRIAATNTWDRFLVEQAVLYIGQQGEFSANNLRDLLPELGHGYLGAAISALRGAGIIQPVGLVPSTSPATKGHRVTVWRLTARGRDIAAHRATRAQRRAA